MALYVLNQFFMFRNLIGMMSLLNLALLHTTSKFPLFLRSRFQESATLQQWIATSVGFSAHLLDSLRYTWWNMSILDEICLVKSPGQPSMVIWRNFDEINFLTFSFISKHGCAQDWSLKSIDGDTSSTGYSCTSGTVTVSGAIERDRKITGRRK